MAWTNPNPSVKQARNQPDSYPAGGPDQTNAAVKDWYQAEAEAATRQPGERRTPSASKPGG